MDQGKLGIERNNKGENTEWRGSKNTVNLKKYNIFSVFPVVIF
jgi:hypothetical protein